jgi:spoIIIJ-associated protein
VEDAIEIAIRELDAERDEVEIDVVSRGKTGVFGIGSEPAKVVVTRISKGILASGNVLDDSSSEDVSVSQGDVIENGRETINKLIEFMGIDVTSNLRRADNEDGGGPLFEIEGDDSGLLIGRKGETLRSFQFLVRFLVGRNMGQRTNVSVDVEGYDDRRKQSLHNLAERVSQRVVRTGRSIELEPMNPRERRLVHMFLADENGVYTESSGSGSDRKIVIFPS